MTADTETDELLPAWLPPSVLSAIQEIARLNDPTRADAYTGVDAERVRIAIDRGDGILAAHRCFGDDDVVDLKLARSALLVARAMIRQCPEITDD